VVAANVGGLPTAVRDGVSGFLIDGHRPDDYATVVARLLEQPRLLAKLGAAGVEHAAAFGWERTAEQTLTAYQQAHDLAALKPMAAAQ
jgi:D-inositol-3-phosphate glycosyltransferase